MIDLTGTIADSGALSGTPARDLGGTIAPSGTLTATPRRDLGGAIAPSGGFSATAWRDLHGTVAPSGAFSGTLHRDAITRPVATLPPIRLVSSGQRRGGIVGKLPMSQATALLPALPVAVLPDPQVRI